MTNFQRKKKFVGDNRIFSERLNEIQERSKKIDFGNLTYYFKTSGIFPINFIKFKGPFVFLLRNERQ